MRSSTEVYKEVAERCHAYNKKAGSDSVSNSYDAVLTVSILLQMSTVFLTFMILLSRI